MGLDSLKPLFKDLSVQTRQNILLPVCKMEKVGCRGCRAGGPECVGCSLITVFFLTELYSSLDRCDVHIDFVIAVWIAESIA